MARPTGSRTALIRITYDDIGRLAGISGDTAKQYAHRGLYDPRDLDSVLCWANARRGAKGLQLIGLPTDNTSDEPSSAHYDDDGPETVNSIPAQMETGSLLNYDPMTGCYREADCIAKTR